jgi:hypothetical protein
MNPCFPRVATKPIRDLMITIEVRGRVGAGASVEQTPTHSEHLVPKRNQYDCRMRVVEHVSEAGFENDFSRGM